MAGPYYVMTSGSNCGSGMIMESSECAAAATALGMSDTTVTTSTSTYGYPQGCTDSSGYLYLYQYDSASCSSTKKCICKIPPSPPPCLPPPLPPPPSPPRPSPPPSPPSPPPPSAPPPSSPPLTCGPGTEKIAESNQCEIVCALYEQAEQGSGSSGTHGRTLEDSDAARSVFESFLLRHPNAAEDLVSQMQKALSEDDQGFRQPTFA